MAMSRSSVIWQTLLVVMIAMFEGMLSGVFGPTLPALQCLFTTNLQTISTIFFVFGLMNSFGSVFGCYILSKVNMFLVLVAVIPVASAGLLTFPFLSNVYGAIAMNGLIATCVGILFNCRIERCRVLWPEHASALHFIMGGYPVGSIVASLVSAPFLHTTLHRTYSTASKYQEFSCSDDYKRVRYAYVILACLGIPLAISFLCTYIRESRTGETSGTPLCTSASYNGNFRRGYILFLVVFFLLCMSVGSIFTTYGGLLTTFGLSSTLVVSAQFMSFLTALFWGTFAGGRFLMAAISGCARQIWIIALGYVGLFTAVIVLVLYGDSSVTYLTVATGLLGLFSAPFSALSFAWASEHVPLTRFVITVGSVGEFTGAMVSPYVGGVLLAVYGAKAFIYVVAAIVAIQFLMFCCLYVIAKCLLERIPNGQESALNNGYEELDDKNSEHDGHQ